MEASCPRGLAVHPPAILNASDLKNTIFVAAHSRADYAERVIIQIWISSHFGWISKWLPVVDILWVFKAVFIWCCEISHGVSRFGLIRATRQSRDYMGDFASSARVFRLSSSASLTVFGRMRWRLSGIVNFSGGKSGQGCQ
jgi:hypothetical protein